jgi:hypothetical protein
MCLSVDDGEHTAVTVLYTDEVHYLPASTTAVWRLCDGRTTVRQAVEKTGLTAEQVLDEIADLHARGIVNDRLHVRLLGHTLTGVGLGAAAWSGAVCAVSAMQRLLLCVHHYHAIVRDNSP